MRGIYVHVPFCLKKCAYCDFYSVAGEPERCREFADLLVREMDLLRRELPGEAEAPADTVYFGGGTPTVLGAERLCALLEALRERFPLEGGAEITVEANPGTAGLEELRALRQGGFNRISLGVQSFEPAVLAVLGRSHGAEEVRRIRREARVAGFASVGFDLIFGIPGQERGGWIADLERAVAFLPAHLSAYALAAEPGTPLHGALGRGELRMPADDEVAAMYEDARRILGGAGYRQYEISNFARAGEECRHNLKYWRREGYRGLGPSAHGLLFPGGAPWGLRTVNPPSLGAWGHAIRDGRLPWSEARACTREDAWKEALIFGLRETAGVDPPGLEEKWGAPPPPLRDALDALVASGGLRQDGTRLRLPPELLFVSNEILVRLA